MTLGQRLAFYRKKSCLTQQQLGKMINVSAQAVSKWENDQAEPDVATICKLSQIYGISTDALLTGKDDTLATPDAIPSKKGIRIAKTTKISHLRTVVFVFIILLIVALVACTFIYIFTHKTANPLLLRERRMQSITHVIPLKTYKGVLL